LCITFDDGYKDNYINAYPILKGYGVPATIYVVTKYINAKELLPWDRLKYLIANIPERNISVPTFGQPLDLSSFERKRKAFYRLNDYLRWSSKETHDEVMGYLEGLLPDKSFRQMHHRESILSWDEIAEMSKEGISFGSHTRTHPRLSTLQMEDVVKEVYGSKKEMEEAMGRKITSFAYPGGDHNKQIRQIVQSAGYSYAVASMKGFNDIKSDLYTLKRRAVTSVSSTGPSGRFSEGLFAAELSGLFDRLFMRGRV
jgi:peptidoglycan/xylan/chitin deacetylase (PgdA/CDA1 family)